jgi:hypothetical protein
VAQLREVHRSAERAERLEILAVRRKGFPKPPNHALRRGATALGLTLLLVLLWSVTHRYQGLGGDARLYAVQALARSHPNLFNDLYLQNTSQDSYSIFSIFYGKCIGLIGLRNAALTLTVVFKIWFYAAAWVLARRLSSDYWAFLGVALLMVAPDAYGAFDVFHYAEDWLTARSLAEALVITSVACCCCGSRFCAVLIACAAMFVHPLMALPGLLLLICLLLPFRLSAFGAAAGILLALGIALGASGQPSIAHFFVIMDANWLEVVRERSQFLFIQFWRAADWSLNIRPYLSLALSALAIDDARVRKFCMGAMLVGATGLAVALIASVVGPVSLLVRGQAWRWVWVTGFTSVLLLAPTVQALWRSEKCGPLCALLMISAWTFPTIQGTACLASALIVWLTRGRINAPATQFLRWVAVLLRRFPGSEFLFIAAVGGFTWCIRANRSAMVLTLAAGMLVAACIYCVPRALQDSGRDGTAAQIDDFSDWRRAIPPNANVFVVPAHNSAAFAWFTLERPSYLTVDQSSGVVFSRDTALEVRRRSQVLLPLMDPDWRLFSNMKGARDGSGKMAPSVRPLTRERLISLCTDPQLNIVIASENLGFAPIRHAHPGDWQGWNLYDCRLVQALTPSA